MSRFPNIDAQISDLTRQVENYCHRQPITESNALISKNVDEFNRWLQAAAQPIDNEKNQIDQQLGTIRKLETEINELNHKFEESSLARRDAEQVKARNRIVEQINQKVEAHRTLAGNFKLKQDAYNKQISHFNDEAKRRRENLEETQKQSRSNAESHLSWLRGRGPELLSKKLTALLSTLQSEKRQNISEAETYDSMIAQLRTLRFSLAQRALHEQEQSEHGLLLTKATLSGSGDERTEQCLLFADNAASFSSITPEMADTLGLDGYHADEVELCLPNGIRIKAPQLVIPSISIDGHSAEFVKAVILNESSPGVDGTIGLSFLSRFDFSIHKGKPQRLILRPLEPENECSPFDVFICHKSEDFNYAHQVFDVLTKGGHRPFLSEISLGNLASGDFHKAIDLAIEGARDLVVVTSSQDNLASAWVEAEWRRFDCLILGGRKRGKIIPILCGEMKMNQLPPALFRYAAIMMDSGQNWQMKLLAALPRF